MTNTFKGIVKLTKQQFETLKEQGSIIIENITYTYSPTDTMYVTNEGYVQTLKVNGVQQPLIDNTIDIDLSYLESQDFTASEWENFSDYQEGVTYNVFED